MIRFELFSKIARSRWLTLAKFSKDRVVELMPSSRIRSSLGSEDNPVIACFGDSYAVFYRQRIERDDICSVVGMNPAHAKRRALTLTAQNVHCRNLFRLSYWDTELQGLVRAKGSDYSLLSFNLLPNINKNRTYLCVRCATATTAKHPKKNKLLANMFRGHCLVTRHTSCTNILEF